MAQFKINERLLRGVCDWPNLWKKDGSVSPVAFRTRKTETGTSVYRKGARTVAQSVQNTAANLEGAIVSVAYEQCVRADIRVTETDETTYHCVLINSLVANGVTALTN